MTSAETPPTVTVPEEEDDGMEELLHESRIMQSGSMLLGAFLIPLPFASGFSKVSPAEAWEYTIMLVCTIMAFIFFVTPAVQHRNQRPLQHRVQFKRRATRLLIAGLVPLSMALALAVHFSVSQVLGMAIGIVFGLITATGVAALWWIYPLATRKNA